MYSRIYPDWGPPGNYFTFSINYWHPFTNYSFSFWFLYNYFFRCFDSSTKIGKLCFISMILLLSKVLGIVLGVSKQEELCEIEVEDFLFIKIYLLLFLSNSVKSCFSVIKFYLNLSIELSNTNLTRSLMNFLYKIAWTDGRFWG